MQNKGYCKWDDEEVKALFLFIETCKKKNLPLTLAFNEYAKKSNRMPNSVRNYYYLELDELLKNKERQEKLKINLAFHEKQNFKEFTEREEYELAYYILQKMRERKSVRSSCLELSKNNVEKMIRYQNKFRSLLKNNVELIKEIEKKLDETFGVKEEQTGGKLLHFPVSKVSDKNRLTDEELKGLFMGLVKLVKKSADLEISSVLKKECNSANENLRRAILEMRKQEEEITFLKGTNNLLQDKVKELENKILSLRVSSVKNIQSFDRESKN